MSEAVIVALIALVGSLGGSLGGILVSNRLSNYRIEQVEKKLERLNDTLNKIAAIEAHLKVLDVRVEDLEKDMDKHHPV